MLRLPRYPVIVGLLALGCAHDSGPANRGPDAKAVVATVDAMFAAMRAHDAAALADLFLDGAVIVHVGDHPDGTVRQRLVPAAEFVESTAQMEADVLERFTSPPQVRIDGPMATVWGPYELVVDGERHHCGVNALQLTRIDGGWKTTAITYTARPCE